MITVEYDSTFIEQATLLAARRSDRFEGELHRAIDPVYEIADEEQRQQAFARVFQEFFARFGLDRPVADLIMERPLISRHVGRCIVREAPRAKDESAELFVQTDTPKEATPGRTLVIHACPQTLLDAQEFTSRMRRELVHVSDMLDERFAYRREAIAGLPARQNLVRDRYRVLWDIYIEGRLEGERLGEKQRGSALRHAFGRVFAEGNASRGLAAFDRVFQAPTLTHHQLLSWAHNPEALFGDGTDSPQVSRPSPGERCPLCGFPTHDWFEFGSDSAHTIASTIKTSNENWSADQGACRQCAELFAATSAPRGGQYAPQLSGSRARINDK